MILIYGYTFMPQFPTVRLYTKSQVFCPQDEERSLPLARGGLCARGRPPHSRDTGYLP